MDRGDFDALVRDHARLMAAAIRRVCGRRHRSLVEDVQQEVYLALWKRLGSGKNIDYPTSYVYKVALTTALAAVRKLGTSLPLEEARQPAAPPSPRELAPPERAHLLDQAISSLGPEEDRAVRAYLAGFNHREIAGLYGWSESTARHRVYRSLEKLAAAMKERDDVRA